MFYCLLLRKPDGSFDMGTSASTPDKMLAKAWLDRWNASPDLQPGYEYVIFEMTAVKS